MWKEKRKREGLESWRVMGKSLAFAVGVPFGIALGAIVGAAFEIRDVSHSAAWGLVTGFGSAGLIGAVFGYWAARRKYKWVRGDLTLAPNTKWDAVVTALNVKAAKKHYLMVRSEGAYVAYSPTLVRPVAVGPLTVSGEYLSIVVTRLNATTITMTGPQYMVDEFETAVEDAGLIEAAGLRE